MTEQSEYVTLGGDVSVTEFGESATLCVITLFFFHFKEFDISIELICDSLRFSVINLLRQRPVAPKKVRNTLHMSGLVL